jgi:hypothetical protein
MGMASIGRAGPGPPRGQPQVRTSSFDPQLTPAEKAVQQAVADAEQHAAAAPARQEHTVQHAGVLGQTAAQSLSQHVQVHESCCQASYCLMGLLFMMLGSERTKP